MKPFARSVWMAPAASTAVEPAGIVGARREERDQAEQSVGEVNHALESGLGDPELLHERRRVLRLQLPQLHLDPRRQVIDHRVLVGVAGGKRGRPSRSGREIRLAHVEQDEHWLLGQEAEAAHRLGLVIGEPGVADRVAGLE
jgi:hypothetical protein